MKTVQSGHAYNELRDFVTHYIEFGKRYYAGQQGLTDAAAGVQQREEFRSEKKAHASFEIMKR